MREGREWVEKLAFSLQNLDLRTLPHTEELLCPILLSVVMNFALLKQVFFPWIIFIEKREANIEIIIDSHSSSRCSLSPRSFWEPAAEFLGTTGNKSTNHLKCSYKNRLNLTFFLWKGLFLQGKCYREILSALRSLPLPSSFRQDLSGRVWNPVLTLCLGHHLSKFFLYYFHAVVFILKWWDKQTEVKAWGTYWNILLRTGTPWGVVLLLPEVITAMPGLQYRGAPSSHWSLSAHFKILLPKCSFTSVQYPYVKETLFF